MKQSKTLAKLFDVRTHPRNEPVHVPRGPLEVLYVNRDGRAVRWPRASKGLAEVVLREAGYVIAED